MPGLETPSIGARLAETRRALGLSEYEMARRMDARINTYLTFERGALTPELFQLSALAETESLSLDWLLLGRGRMFIRVRMNRLRRWIARLVRWMRYVSPAYIPFWAQGAMTFALFIVGVAAFLLWTHG